MSSNVHALEGIRPLRSEVDRPDQADVEAAFRTIIRWAGDDPEREGLIETPSRMARSFKEFFVGYAQDPVAFLQKTFEEIEGYDEMIVLRGIRLRYERGRLAAMTPALTTRLHALVRGAARSWRLRYRRIVELPRGEHSRRFSTLSSRCLRAARCQSLTLTDPPRPSSPSIPFPTLAPKSGALA